MQGKFSSELTLPLNELLTVVLITHNRPAFLRRAVKYYSSLPCKIMVLDSTIERPEGDFSAVDYHHVPQFAYWGMQAKLAYGVERLTTPYMVLAADDDFILHDSLAESVNFLHANQDYGMCHGYCLMYLTLTNGVNYYRRDKKVQEDYASERAQDRVIDYMSQYIPPFYAVTRTDLMKTWHSALPAGTNFQWQEIGHVYFLLASAKARILPIPYVVREINYGVSEHNTDVFHSLTYVDSKSVAEREAFAEFLTSLPCAIEGLDAMQAKAFALESFDAMAESLRSGRALTAELIFESVWSQEKKVPDRRFGPLQYVEMPFYNQAFFDRLEQFEFMLHAMPAGRIQLEGLEGVWTRQAHLLQARNNDTAESVTDRLWQAHDLNAFNQTVVKRLSTQLQASDEDEAAHAMNDWIARLEAFADDDQQAMFDKTKSGRLLKWLAAREPSAEQSQAIARHLAVNGGGPQFGIFLLDLDNDIDKLQVSLDSLLEGHCKAFRIVVFTTGEAPSATTAQNTLHFVRVTQSNFVDKLNQSAQQSPCDWLLLAQAGDQFTASGLLRASLELMDAAQIRAVATDEIQRQESGALVDVFRPGINLDLLQSVPSLMARHWLVRRDVLLDAGGYQADFNKALELDLLLRIIEQGGLDGLAHLDEPLLITQAVAPEENAHERQALLRHLGNRGYKAKVNSTLPGTWQIDYRHAEQPLVSIIVPVIDDVRALQRCLESVVLKTRYSRFEVLVAANPNTSAEVNDWLGSLQHAKVRVLRADQPLCDSALCNAASEQAQGD
jgi:glycosyltransferase domain-containing protein